MSEPQCKCGHDPHIGICMTKATGTPCNCLGDEPLCDKCSGPLAGSRYRRPDTPEMVRQQLRPGGVPMVLVGGELNVQPPLCKPCWIEESPLAVND